MKIKNEYTSISLSEAANTVAAVGNKLTCLISGEMGIGKSSMLKTLAERFPTHIPIYLEAQTLDLGDLQMPKFNGDVVSFVPNESLGLHLGKPVLLMIDELGKASKSVMNALLRVMLERKLGVRTLHEDSIVFATTNLAVEGVGDNVPHHARNRLCQMKVRKPTAMQWVEDFAIKAKLHPVIIGSAMEYPSMFASFEDYEDPTENHYIFNPKQPRPAFVTPRSLEKASDILYAAEAAGLSDAVLIHALMGVVGEAAAMDIVNIKSLDDALPAWDRVMTDPENCPLPKGGVASVLLATKALHRVERETVDSWMTYLKRLPAEVVALFMRNAVRSKDKNSIYITNRKFVELNTEKSFLFM